MGTEFKAFLIKIILPSLVALSIKLSIQSQRKRVSLVNILTSFSTGIGCAYLFSDYAITHLSHEFVPLAIAVVTLSGEKIGAWFMFKFDVEGMLDNAYKKIRK